MTPDEAIETLREWASAYPHFEDRNEAVRVLADAVAERDKLRAALEDIAKGRWNTASASLDLGQNYTRMFNANDYARAALGSVAPAKERKG